MHSKAQVSNVCLQPSPFQYRWSILLRHACTRGSIDKHVLRSISADIPRSVFTPSAHMSTWSRTPRSFFNRNNFAYIASATILFILTVAYFITSTSTIPVRMPITHVLLASFKADAKPEAVDKVRFVPDMPPTGDSSS
jgi:hypothetical protein